MNKIFRQTQLYKYLNYCNDAELEKVVLDCGAGGNCPPLALFSSFGYETYGIELSDKALDKAHIFEQENNMRLNISKGNITKLPYEDNSFSFVYSFNTIFHMRKKDITTAVNEIKRVLKPGGLCFVNFLTINDQEFGIGEKLGEGEYRQIEDGENVIHTYYTIDEAEKHFFDMKILYKENRILDRIYEGKMIRQGYVDYIVKK